MMATFQKNNLAIQLAAVRTFHGLFRTFWACASLSKPKQESVNFLMALKVLRINYLDMTNFLVDSSIHC
jgi:hypothetical protein